MRNEERVKGLLSFLVPHLSFLISRSGRSLLARDVALQLVQFELLVLDDDLRKQIAANTPLAQIKTEARKKGMLYLQEVALYKVYEGLTSINEVLRVTKEPEAAATAKAS